jgi:hypothetical protein
MIAQWQLVEALLYSARHTASAIGSDSIPSCTLAYYAATGVVPREIQNAYWRGTTRRYRTLRSRDLEIQCSREHSTAGHGLQLLVSLVTGVKSSGVHSSCQPHSKSNNTQHPKRDTRRHPHTGACVPLCLTAQTHHGTHAQMCKAEQITSLKARRAPQVLQALQHLSD